MTSNGFWPGDRKGSKSAKNIGNGQHVAAHAIKFTRLNERDHRARRSVVYLPGDTPWK